MVPTFVVGTGRCGSTMLSNMVREHPRILSLCDFADVQQALRGACELGFARLTTAGVRYDS
jgi:hypothetical protein